jgi:hypothetical protein
MNVHLRLDLACEGGGGGMNGVETTSSLLWHAREVELVRIASKSHESPPRLGLACEGSGGEANALVCKGGGGGADGWVRGA